MMLPSGTTRLMTSAQNTIGTKEITPLHPGETEDGQCETLIRQCALHTVASFLKWQGQVSHDVVFREPCAANVWACPKQ